MEKSRNKNNYSYKEKPYRKYSRCEFGFFASDKMKPKTHHFYFACP